MKVAAVVFVLAVSGWSISPSATGRTTSTSMPSTQPQRPAGLEILTPHPGIDFTGFSADLLRVVRQNWYAKMPSEATTRKMKGRVVIDFGIQKDGQLRNAQIEVSSGNQALDGAAFHAITASAPFEHLPKDFTGPSIRLRLTFLYNLPPGTAGVL
jgi:TonB family protein